MGQIERSHFCQCSRGSCSVVVTDNNIAVKGFSWVPHYQCSGYQCCVSRCIDNSNTDVPVMFNIRSQWNIPLELFLYLITQQWY